MSDKCLEIYQINNFVAGVLADKTLTPFQKEQRITAAWVKQATAFQRAVSNALSRRQWRDRSLQAHGITRHE